MDKQKIMADPMRWFISLRRAEQAEKFKELDHKDRIMVLKLLVKALHENGGTSGYYTQVKNILTKLLDNIY